MSGRNLKKVTLVRNNEEIDSDEDELKNRIKFSRLQVGAASAGLEMNKRMKPDSGDMFGGHSTGTMLKSSSSFSASSRYEPLPSSGLGAVPSADLVSGSAFSSSTTIFQNLQPESSPQEATEKKHYTLNFTFN